MQDERRSAKRSVDRMSKVLLQLSANHTIEGMSAVCAKDEYGRPFIILREQQKKSRLSGIEAQKVKPRVCNALYTAGV